MLNPEFWITIGIAVVLGFLACIGSAFVAEPLRRVFARLTAMFYVPANEVYRHCRERLILLKQWIFGQVAKESVDDRGPTYFVVGSTLYTLLTAVFVAADYSIVVLTFEAMGLETATWKLPIESSVLAAVSMMAVALFWGLLLGDLYGLTHLAPWAKALEKVAQKHLKRIAWGMIITMAIMAGIAGYWRFETVESTNAIKDQQAQISQMAGNESSLGVDPELMSLLSQDGEQMPMPQEQGFWAGMGSWPKTLIMVGLPLITILTTAFSGVGIVIWSKFMLVLGVAIGASMLGLVTLISWLWSLLMSTLLGVVEAGVGLFISIGMVILYYLGFDLDRLPEFELNEDDQRNRQGRRAG